jgi:formamidopyrimidine-DNA glycosylase
LDQRLIAGLGNIYVRGAMARPPVARARRRSVATKTGADAAAGRLAVAIREASTRRSLPAAVLAIIAAPTASSRLPANCCLDREGEPCLRPGCRGIVRRKVQSGRSTFYCAVCQH